MRRFGRSGAGGAATSWLALATLVLAAPAVADEPSWARRALDSLSLEQKAGQVIMPMIRTHLAHPESERARRVEALVRELGVGGVILSRGEPLENVAFLNRLQSLAKLPLLVAADLEWGVGIQIPRGATLLPGAMAVAATGSEQLAFAHGRATAREARALGIHLTFAPVADVNNNPDNPIINVRSYGEDPEAVGRMAAAFVRGARAGGLLSTAKHFPGHGDTAVDTHSSLATLSGDRARLDRVELPPFQAAIAAGVDAIMVGHLRVPSLDPSGVPATVSRKIVTGLLREQLGFDGLVVSDAMDMLSVAGGYAPGEAAVRALAAGEDLIVMSPAPERVRAAIVAAVRKGRLEAGRLDEAVLRLLTLKQRLGLDVNRLTSLEDVWTQVGDPEQVAQMQTLADRSITLVKNEGHLVPLRRMKRGLLHVTLSGDRIFERLHDLPEAEVKRRVPRTTQALVDPRTGQEELERILDLARSSKAVLVSAFVRVRPYKGTAAMPDELAEFLTELADVGRPVIVISYGSPYLLRQFPNVSAYLCAYSDSRLSQKAAMKAVFGEIAITGRLPVSLPGLFPLGHGLTAGEAGGS